MTRDDYFRSDGVSRSRLVSFDTHPNLFHTGGVEKDSYALRFGDAFDTLMFDGKDAVDSRFKFASTELPFSIDTVPGTVVSNMLRIVKENPEAILDREKLLQTAAECADLNSKTAAKTLEKVNVDSVYQYITEIVDPNCLKGSDRHLLESMRNAILLDKRYNGIFNPFPDGTNHVKDGDNEYFHQVAVYFKHIPTGIQLKVLLDIIHVDHKEKAVRKIDLKTTYESFPKDVDRLLFEHRYDIQAGLYSLGAAIWTENNFPDYRCDLGFDFLFVPKSLPAKECFLVKMPQSEVETIIDGTPSRRGRKLRNINEMLIDLKWHMDNEVWSYPRRVIENKGYVAKIYD